MKTETWHVVIISSYWFNKFGTMPVCGVGQEAANIERNKALIMKLMTQQQKEELLLIIQ